MSIFSFNCPSCGGIHSIDSAEAEEHCRSLMDRLEREGRINFETENDDPRLSTAPLFSEARGQMFGVLVCAPEAPGFGKTILKAYSGQYNGRWEVPGWVSPILSPADFAAAVRRADPPIKELSTRINALPAGEQRSELISERRELSQQHMKEIHEMYTIRNFSGEAATLFRLFESRIGIPAGTGDCCAPKLLNAAVLRGLKPLSLAEFFYGRENRSGTKAHRQFYPPCDDKCRPILGFMLCGADKTGGPAGA